VPASLSTSSATEPDPECRLALIVGWTELPDLVNPTRGKRAIIEISHALRERVVGIEAGLLCLQDAGGLTPPLPVPILPRGRDQLTVYAWDWAGNTSALDYWIKLPLPGTAAASSTELGPLAPRLDSP
jgi:hypothetical protein